MTVASRTRVKICGLTRPVDVQAVIQAGADAVGLVFYPASRRCVSLAQAAALRSQVPAFMSVVALFVNPQPEDVRQVLDAVHPDLLQFHGEESVAFCEQFGVRYLKAFRVGAPGLDSAASLAAACARYPDASGWLFDSYSPAYGGSGHRLDAELLSQLPRGGGVPALILSGGLTVDGVGADMAARQPFAVDVSSGVESAPGIKDPAKIQAFMQAVQAADRRRCGLN
ncbi:phosphoribosylanthranilate isomerase [Castellaniella sp.]|uniref:phosphoribosylanthranilate isomerase n=1 Tax=Castellaniella sp. TaxID=1955812 RepID=UPI002AFDD06F|nr:phosphoribosylanthranilate isomerase [Castellaniella sp.]